MLPAIGMVLTGVLWANLHLDALTYGLIWLAIGIVTLLVLTRAFRKRLGVKLDEDGDAAIITREGAPSEVAR
jgi:putrescine importer